MTRHHDIVNVDVQVLHETERAVLVTPDVPDNGVWLPRSKIEIAPTGFDGIFTVSMPEWLALEKGLI